MIICPSEQCTGCGACVAVCPTKSISFQSDAEGFVSPQIDINTCINCNNCVHVCPANNAISTSNYVKPRAMACQLKDSEVLHKSSSGGAFSAIAQQTLSRNGVVFGCTMDQQLDVYHLGITDMQQKNLLHGSKYLQSNTRDTFIEVKRLLAQEIQVLYVGCACQIAGLYASLGSKKYPTLTTVDLVCHGVGSPAFFHQYTNELSKHYSKQIINVDFRSKDRRSSSYVSKISFIGREPIYIKALDDAYMNCYLRCAIYRECCYRCKYATLPRVADFTIGDFVGVEQNENLNFSATNGVSLVLLNNEYAESLFEKISLKLNYLSRPLEEATSTNLNLIRPSSRPPYRDVILKQTDLQVSERMKKYCKTKLKTRLGVLLGANNVKKIKSLFGKIRPSRGEDH